MLAWAPSARPFSKTLLVRTLCFHSRAWSMPRGSRCVGAPPALLFLASALSPYEPFTLEPVLRDQRVPLPVTSTLRPHQADMVTHFSIWACFPTCGTSVAGDSLESEECDCGSQHTSPSQEIANRRPNPGRDVVS